MKKVGTKGTPTLSCIGKEGAMFTERDVKKAELGEYLIAELSVFDTKFSIEYQKKQRLVHGKIKPIALLKETSGFIVYKKNSGENIVTVIEKINNEWVIVEEKTFKGISFDDLEETFNNEFN